MKSKKKTNKIKTKKASSNKKKPKKLILSAPVSKEAQELFYDTLVCPSKSQTHPTNGWAYEQKSTYFGRLEQEHFGLTQGSTHSTLGAAQKKGCLDKEKAQNIYAGSSFEDFLDDVAERQRKQEVIESEKSKKSWVDSFFAIFGFKRKL